MDARHIIWCDEDEHSLYEHYADFNDWLNGDDGQELRVEYGIDELTQPSKAFYAGDREAYDQAFREYRIERRHESLNQTYLQEQFGGDHWFQRNRDHFEQLINCIESGQVVPFVGAGISASGGFPSWKEHLREQGRTAGINQDHIEELLSEGAYENILEEIEQERGREVFTQEIRDVFSRIGSISDVVWRITELFKDTVITTNYDRLIEQAYDTGEENAFQIINGMNALEQPKPGRVTIIKLHGDIQKPTRCILSKNQYDDAYGNDGLDLDRQIPKLLSYHYKTSSLLFLGCSLNNDRTVHVFQAVKAQIGDEDRPQHFSIEQAPEDEGELIDRNAYLARLGITGIWFEKGRFDKIESMLRLAKNELGHRGVFPGSSYFEDEIETGNQVNLDVELSSFLHDFVDLMPLMHWLHRHVPHKETKQYLSAMQRVFVGQSLFTDHTDIALVDGLDHLCRALSNSPRFDRYTLEKLSIASRRFLEFVESVCGKGCSENADQWDFREMLLIPALRLEELITNYDEEKDLDYQAMRLIVAMLRHGLNQLDSSDHYCELPDNVNAEFGDYIALSLSLTLGVRIPDRLEDMFADDAVAYCKNAWENFDKPVKIGLVKRAKLMLEGLGRNRRETLN